MEAEPGHSRGLRRSSPQICPHQRCASPHRVQPRVAASPETNDAKHRPSSVQMRKIEVRVANPEGDWRHKRSTRQADLHSIFPVRDFQQQTQILFHIPRNKLILCTVTSLSFQRKQPKSWNCVKRNSEVASVSCVLVRESFVMKHRRHLLGNRRTSLPRSQLRVTSDLSDKKEQRHGRSVWVRSRQFLSFTVSIIPHRVHQNFQCGPWLFCWRIEASNVQKMQFLKTCSDCVRPLSSTFVACSHFGVINSKSLWHRTVYSKHCAHNVPCPSKQATVTFVYTSLRETSEVTNYILVWAKQHILVDRQPWPVCVGTMQSMQV